MVVETEVEALNASEALQMLVRHDTDIIFRKTIELKKHMGRPVEIETIDLNVYRVEGTKLVLEMAESEAHGLHCLCSTCAMAGSRG